MSSRPARGKARKTLDLNTPIGEESLMALPSAAAVSASASSFVSRGHRKGGAFNRHDLLRALDRPQGKVAAVGDFHGFHHFS